MFASRSLSRVAVKGSARNISLLKHVSPARSLSFIASRPVLTPRLVSRSRLNANSYLLPASVSSLSFTRFNSTSTSGNETSQATENATPDGLIPNIEDIPERLGYLKELGLDFGWGPSSFMEWTIEHLHILLGMPWWASIVGAAVLVRLALFKTSVWAADNAARTAPLKDKMTEIRSRRIRLMQQGNQLEASKVKLELDDLYKNNNINLWNSFWPMLQIPLGFGIFRVVRGMSTLPVPALAVEELAWISDLTSYDPLYVMPALTTAFMYLSMKKGATSGDMTSSAFGRLMVHGLPVVSFLFIMWQPAALQLYFASAGFLGLVQSYLLNTSATRAYFGVAPIHKPTGDATKPSFRMIRENLIRELEQAKQQQQAGLSSEVAVSATKHISTIDKWMNNTKKEISTLKQELNGTVEKYTQDNNTTNNVKPRLTAEEKADADSYKALREIDDASDTRKLNKQRRREFRAHEQTENPHIVTSWQDIRKKAKEAAAANPPKKPASTSRTKSKARK